MRYHSFQGVSEKISTFEKRTMADFGTGLGSFGKPVDDTCGLYRQLKGQQIFGSAGRLTTVLIRKNKENIIE